MDTIAAIATPIGSGGIGVVRISGLMALEVAVRVFRPDPSDLPSHKSKHGKLFRPGTNDELDDVVLTLFRAPTSYTGENVVEISCHGGIVTVKAALQAVLDAGARLAQPGEFTQRAFLNGKLDLAQAEAVNDLIRSRTDDARKVARRQLDGVLSARISEISSSLLETLAAIEASTDFPEDVSEPDRAWLQTQIAEARERIDTLLASFGRGRVYREGLRVVIVGRVNVGKSSLLNALLRHARAIVTPVPGTTRDLIEESLEIHGIPIVAIDTAGLRATDDPVEKIGVDLTHQSIGSADVVLLVIDAMDGLHEEDRGLIEQINTKPLVLVVNKIDLLSPSAQERLEGEAIYTSAATGEGIEQLESKIAEIAGAGDLGGESIVVSNIRHREALESALESMNQAHTTLTSNEPIDLLSGDLSSARNALGLITGETATDDLLDHIFGEFCIGK